MNQSLKFVFWNVHKNTNNISIILQHGKENDVDVIALCEVPDDFRTDNDDYILYDGMGYEKNGLRVFAKKTIHLYCANDEKRFVVYRMEAPIICSFAVVHLNSEMSKNANRYRDVDIRAVKEKISIIEKKCGDKNSFVIGDLNENLFDDHLVSWHGFNVRYFKCLMEKETEQRHGVTEDIYYCPLLQEYKDSDEDHLGKGTYYFENDPVGWLCYDYVLMKKQIMNRFKPNSFKILHVLSSHPLVRENKPCLEYSDHLPITFELLFEGAL